MYQLTVRAAATSAPHNTGTRRARSPRGYIYQPVSPTRRALSRFLDRIIQGLRVWLASMAGHGAHNSRTQVDTYSEYDAYPKYTRYDMYRLCELWPRWPKRVRASRHARWMFACNLRYHSLCAIAYIRESQRETKWRVEIAIREIRRIIYLLLFIFMHFC